MNNAIIDEPEVQCEASSISLLFKTKAPFGGKIFVKGYVADAECVQVGDSVATSHRFDVAHDACGVRRQREVNGVIISSTIIVSFHSIFITKIDRAYRVSCFYVEANKRVNNHVDVASLTTQVLEGQTQLPVCRYEILNDPQGAPIKYARIGETVFHRWSCESELDDVYCMRVHTCTVYDGQGGPPVTVIDANGCSADGVILQNLDYSGDLSATRAAQVFKFADKAGLYFNCQIQLTIKDRAAGCQASQPKCVAQTYVEPSSKTTEVSSEYNSVEGHESGYPTKPASNGPLDEGRSPQPPSSYPSSPSPPAPPPFATTAAPAIYVETDQNNIVLKVSSAPPDGYEAQNDTEEPFTTTSAYTEDGIYGRLIKRNVQAEQKRPVTVADVDLPERGILVFGLEDVDGDDSGAALHRPEALTERTCFSTSRLYASATLLFFAVLFVVSVFCFVVYRQRTLISTTFLKP
ncbi:unnamed protein product [Caenorhabditis auriculariae]|uniref:ZP domain-containing protein n=1 Tax=Caenorhabditis auriculariae TaxID=2777116 RepID=A0A8S1HVA3_9PELO|nr:unnamed protein product [Caenorhabditis auriculariae]